MPNVTNPPRCAACDEPAVMGTDRCLRHHGIEARTAAGYAAERAASAERRALDIADPIERACRVAALLRARQEGVRMGRGRSAGRPDYALPRTSRTPPPTGDT